MVFCVRYAIRTLVCLKSFVTNWVSFPIYVNVANLCGVLVVSCFVKYRVPTVRVQGIECFSPLPLTVSVKVFCLV